MTEDIEVFAEEIDSEKARTWLLNFPYERQRNMRVWWVQKLKNIMRAGKFKQGTQISFGVLNGSEYLTNGQHRLTAINETGLPQTFSILKTRVQNEEELAQLYIAEDRHLTRSFVDIARAYDLQDKLNLTQSQLSKMKTAIGFIQVGFSTGRVRGGMMDTDMFYLLESFAVAGKNYFKLIAGQPREMKIPLTRAATLSVALTTLKETPKEIMWRTNEFWHGLALPELDTWSENDARMLCFKHLVTTTMPYGNISKRGVHIIAQSASARYVAACYNYWMNGGEFVEPTISEQIEDIEIAFTSYKKKSDE